MTRTALLYALIIGAALIAGLAIPFAIHSEGSRAVPGWQGLVSPGSIFPVHRSIAADCESCHTPHVGVEAKNCLSCHAGRDFADRQSTRFHARAVQCTACHIEHDRERGLTRMDHDALLVPRFWAGGQSDATTRKATAAGVAASLDCDTCHSNRDPHRGYFGTQCSACHILTTWQIPRFSHPSERSTQCAECHQPPPSHRMGHFEMVSQRVAGERARLDQCYACHTTDSWNNIRGRGYYKHH